MASEHKNISALWQIHFLFNSLSYIGLNENYELLKVCRNKSNKQYYPRKGGGEMMNKFNQIYFNNV